MKGDQLSVQPVNGVPPLPLSCLLTVGLRSQLVSLDLESGELGAQLVEFSHDLHLVLVRGPYGVPLAAEQHVLLNFELLDARSLECQLVSAVCQLGLGFAHLRLDLDVVELGLAHLILSIKQVALDLLELGLFGLELLRKFLNFLTRP